MYCPRCATHNIDDTKFCRSCGANLALVPQALTGQLPERGSRRRYRHRHRDDGPATVEGAITKLFAGIGFLLVSMAVWFFFPGGRYWWFWLLIPAFSILGKGIAEVVSLKLGGGADVRTGPNTLSSGIQTGELNPNRNEVALPPPSVTEQTTRQLDPKTDPYRYRDRDAG